MRTRILVLGLACLFFIASINLGPIKIDVVKKGPQGRYSFVKVKITNTSGKHINRCKLSCILYKDKKEIDVKTHYVIKSTEGGLKSGKFTFFEYVFSTGYEEWNKTGFNIETIDYKKK